MMTFKYSVVMGQKLEWILHEVKTFSCIWGVGLESVLFMDFGQKNDKMEVK